MEKFLNSNHPLRCNICGPSNVGNSVFLTKLKLNFINEYDKIYIYSPSLHEDLYQKLINCFSIYIPIHIKPNILSKEDIDIVVDEKVNNKDYQKSDTEIESYESIEELKYPQENEGGGIIILDELNGKELNVPRVQAMFRRSRQNNLSIFIFSQDYYELPKRTIPKNGNIYHILKPNNFRDLQNLYQDKSSMDMTLDKFKYLTSTCWDKQCQPLTIDKTIDRYQGRYRLGLTSIFIPDSTPF